MKICASCGASLPDGAAFCITCGSKEFVAAVVPDLDAPQPEKPKIESILPPIYENEEKTAIIKEIQPDTVEKNNKLNNFKT